MGFVLSREARHITRARESRRVHEFEYPRSSDTRRTTNNERESRLKPTEILMQEHRVIERVLAAMQTAMQRATSDQQLQPTFFLDAVEFIQGYADAYHHAKEEGVLFKEMEAQGFPTEGGPIAVMLSEHEQARAYTGAMKSAAERWDGGEASARSEVTHNAQGYVSLLSDHIYKEDNILYPMADQLLSPEDQERMAETFREMEGTATSDGSLTRFLAIVDRLEKAMRVVS